MSFPPKKDFLTFLGMECPHKRPGGVQPVLECLFDGGGCVLLPMLKKMHFRRLFGLLRNLILILFFRTTFFSFSKVAPIISIYENHFHTCSKKQPNFRQQKEANGPFDAVFSVACSHAATKISIISCFHLVHMWNSR